MLIYLIVSILLFIVIGSTVGNTVTKQGTVFSKEFVQAHTETRLIGKVVTIESIPDEWFIKVELGYDTYTNCKVPYTKYTSLSKRDEVTVIVSEGLFTGNYYCEYL
jgi:regulator of RNase E activity RraA